VVWFGPLPEAWRQRQRLPFSTAALTTAGGLVFVGDLDRRFYAMDVATGKVLWQATTPTAADGFPITYAVNGKQYLAVPSGPGWFIAWNQVLECLSTPVWHSLQPVVVPAQLDA
jgi:alcohol dehydrogenase (cytochrome c)